MSIVFPVNNIFKRFAESVAPAHRPIGRAGTQAGEQRAPKVQRTQPMPIGMRSARQQLADELGGPIAGKASGSVPFSTRFAILVFSVRLKFTGSTAGLNALRTEVKTLQKSLADANDASSAAALGEMKARISDRLAKQDPQHFIPEAGGRQYQGW